MSAHVCKCQNIYDYVKMKSKNRLEVMLNFTPTSTRTVLCMFKLNLLKYTMLLWTLVNRISVHFNIKESMASVAFCIQVDVMFESSEDL